ncbi:hypothetical protein NPIL_521081 [Nephila pilipes]|uniref:Uncharacterized protein n=1 Tax=Nephila pilipes TaxID=299642 RepID=A0A8X6NG35_NEPPI|nr:hypothetical protein NPIL_521081 [Nephila pilipes]
MVWRTAEHVGGSELRQSRIAWPTPDGEANKYSSSVVRCADSLLSILPKANPPALKREDGDSSADLLSIPRDEECPQIEGSLFAEMSVGCFEGGGVYPTK